MGACAQAGQLPPDNMMPSFQDIQETVGFPEYFAQAERYAANEALSSSAERRTDTPPPSSTSQWQPQAPSAPDNSASPEQPTTATEMGTGSQQASRKSERSQEERRDLSASSDLRTAAEEGQRAVQSKEDSSEAMAKGELSSLDEELHDLDSGDGEPSRESVAPEQDTPVVEADAIVVSGRRQGVQTWELPSEAPFLRLRMKIFASFAAACQTDPHNWESGRSFHQHCVQTVAIVQIDQDAANATCEGSCRDSVMAVQSLTRKVRAPAQP